VLLPSDIHRKTITSVTAVLLPFVDYSLTLPRIQKAQVGRERNKCHLRIIYKLKMSNKNRFKIRKVLLASVQSSGKDTRVWEKHTAYKFT
jgi:hypothetical protein